MLSAQSENSRSLTSVRKELYFRKSKSSQLRICTRDFCLTLSSKFDYICSYFRLSRVFEIKSIKVRKDITIRYGKFIAFSIDASSSIFKILIYNKFTAICNLQLQKLSYRNLSGNRMSFFDTSLAQAFPLLIPHRSCRNPKQLLAKCK